jgi:hypothetical protein
MTTQRDPDPAPKQHALEATVRTASKAEYQGQVSATQPRVATIEFAREGAPLFLMSEELTVVFRSREVFEPFAARSRVIFRQDDIYRSSYKFRFSERDGQALNALFKRRGSLRMRADEEVSVETRAWGEKDGPTLDCGLRDISKTGMSLRVGAQGEVALCRADRLHLRFRLPGDGELFDLSADVRYRQLADDTVQYGLEFDWTDQACAAASMRRIEAFILRRKSAIIGRALGASWLPPAA